MANRETGDRNGQLPPAGPDTVQRFNSQRLLVASVVAMLASFCYLVAEIVTARSVLIALLAVLGSVILFIVAFRFARRFWVRRDGTTLDEADPRRTPEQQRRRDERVRKNNAELTPRQEVLAGAILIPVGVAWPFLFAIPEGETDGGDFLLGLAFVILGIYLLVHAAVVRRRLRLRRKR